MTGSPYARTADSRVLLTHTGTGNWRMTTSGPVIYRNGMQMGCKIANHERNEIHEEASNGVDTLWGRDAGASLGPR